MYGLVVKKMNLESTNRQINQVIVICRSSFGMALKDKFQRNPNMYFPPDGQVDPQFVIN